MSRRCAAHLLRRLETLVGPETPHLGDHALHSGDRGLGGSASRSDGSATGQSAITIDSRPVSAVHSVSVTNGTIGCSSRNVTSSTWPSTARAASASVAAAAPSGKQLGSSMYQSKTSSQAKWYRASDNLANWKSS